MNGVTGRQTGGKTLEDNSWVDFSALVGKPNHPAFHISSCESTHAFAFYYGLISHAFWNPEKERRISSSTQKLWKSTSYLILIWLFFTISFSRPRIYQNSQHPNFCYFPRQQVDDAFSLVQQQFRGVFGGLRAPRRRGVLLRGAGCGGADGHGAGIQGTHAAAKLHRHQAEIFFFWKKRYHQAKCLEIQPKYLEYPWIKHISGALFWFLDVVYSSKNSYAFVVETICFGAWFQKLYNCIIHWKCRCSDFHLKIIDIVGLLWIFSPRPAPITTATTETRTTARTIAIASTTVQQQ